MTSPFASEDQAYDLGYEHARDGLPPECPYALDSMEATAYLDGYESARLDINDEDGA